MFLWKWDEFCLVFSLCQEVHGMDFTVDDSASGRRNNVKKCIFLGILISSNFVCGRPHGAVPLLRPPVHMNPPQPDPLCVNVINGWPLLGTVRQIVYWILCLIQLMSILWSVVSNVAHESKRHFSATYVPFILGVTAYSASSLCKRQWCKMAKCVVTLVDMVHAYPLGQTTQMHISSCTSGSRTSETGGAKFFAEIFSRPFLGHFPKKCQHFPKKFHLSPKISEDLFFVSHRLFSCFNILVFGRGGPNP